MFAHLASRRGARRAPGLGRATPICVSAVVAVMTAPGTPRCTITAVATSPQGAGGSSAGRRRLAVALGVLAVLLALAAALGFTFGTMPPAPSGGSSSGSATAAPPGPAIDGLSGTWRLKLDDDFDSTSLDRNLWHTCYSW
jgi:hypothetical protein